MSRSFSQPGAPVFAGLWWLQQTLRRRPRLRVNSLLLIVAAYLATLLNGAFWHQVVTRLPASLGVHELGIVAALLIGLQVLLLLVMLPFSTPRLIRPFAAVLIVVAASNNYFMQAYGVVLDASMMANTFQTDPREARELLTASLFAHLLFTGLLPAALLLRVEIDSGGAVREWLRRLALLLLALAALLGAAAANYKGLSLWVREHREIRLYVNPTYPLYSLQRYLRGHEGQTPVAIAPIATDAVRRPAASGKPRMLIMVVGETARAANFQLFGYARPTSPEMAARDDVVAYSHTQSCGTATAFSVPCMFSRLGRDGFSRSKAAAEENLLDVLRKTGVDVLWRDNNSDCKGVCLRVPSEDLRHRDDAALCHDGECYDEVLLDGLDQRLGETRRDSVIVLHLLGSHGPSYYKRYPPAFRRFTPDCTRDDVQNCSREEIVNAYDNSILYTDHVLGELLRLLQRHADRIEPSLIYLSDHGESLGENGIYLHGLPYALAPDEQKHVPLLIWAPARDQACMRARRDQPSSQDNLFPTVLGLFSIGSREYQRRLDLLDGCQ